MKYKLIIFDLDGTLADTIPWFIGIINQLAGKHNLRSLTGDDYRAIRNLEAEGIFEYLRVPWEKIPMLENDLRELMKQDIGHISVFHGTHNLLRHLSKIGKTLAVVTSNSLGNAHQILGPENAPLINFYDCGVSTFDKSKKLVEVMKKSGFSNTETIYIGDEVRDNKAAKNAHIAFGGVSWGYNTMELLKTHSPDELFTSVDEIAVIIT